MIKLKRPNLPGILSPITSNVSCGSIPDIRPNRSKSPLSGGKQSVNVGYLEFGGCRKAVAGLCGNSPVTT
jgi:hypothetical protein